MEELKWSCEKNSFLITILDTILVYILEEKPYLQQKYELNTCLLLITKKYIIF